MKKRDGAAPQTIALLRGSAGKCCARYLRSRARDIKGVLKNRVVMECI